MVARTPTDRIAFKDIFNDMADKHVQIKDLMRLKRQIMESNGSFEGVRYKGISRPAAFVKGILNSIFRSKSQETEDLMKTDMYVPTDRFPWPTRSVISKDLYISLARDIYDENKVYKGYSARSVAAELEAWNRAPDRSDDIRKFKFKPIG